MGDLLNEIHDNAAKRGKQSRILEILSGLSNDDQKDLITALDDKSIPASNISKAMKKRGYKLDISVINRYRRGELLTDIHESF